MKDASEFDILYNSDLNEILIAMQASYEEPENPILLKADGGFILQRRGDDHVFIKVEDTDLYNQITNAHKIIITETGRELLLRSYTADMKKTG